MYFENQKYSILAKASSIELFYYSFKAPYNQSGVYLLVMISCDIPKEIENLVPKAIALSTVNSCDTKLNNYLRVIYEKPIEKKLFGVCVQALRFSTTEYSVRLIEWLELMRILGADKVFLYALSVNENMLKVLNYYSQQVFIIHRIKIFLQRRVQVLYDDCVVLNTNIF